MPPICGEILRVAGLFLVIHGINCGLLCLNAAIFRIAATQSHIARAVSPLATLLIFSQYHESNRTPDIQPQFFIARPSMQKCCDSQSLESTAIALFVMIPECLQ